MPESTTERVAMVWPLELKEAVRAKVGGRGLTKFTLAAVEAKLGTYDEHREDSKELSEVKFLAQRLADALAMGESYEDRESVLREIDLPPWIETAGWPEHLVQAINPEESTPEPVKEPEPVPGPERPIGIDPRGAEAAAAPGSDDDLLSRVQAKALEKGVDLSDFTLKPASQIEKLSEEERQAKLEEIRGSEPEPAVEPEPESEPEPEPSEPEASASDRCQKCGAELVNGECWECF